MKERLSNLLTIKSIVTLLLTLVFCYLSIIGVIPAELFMTVFTVVIAFYFGTQNTKKSAGNAYVGPQQGQTLPQRAEPTYDSVDPMTAHQTHPPDAEPVAKVGFEY